MCVNQGGTSHPSKQHLSRKLRSYFSLQTPWTFMPENLMGNAIFLRIKVNQKKTSNPSNMGIGVKKHRVK